MNFSEYTLVSFGDSFTFGEDTVPVPGWHIRNEIVDKELEQKYISDCHSNSYTQFLADNLEFKDSLNFGFKGASNDKSMMALESFLRNNPKKKVFILFNFTSSSRYAQIFKKDDKNEYEIVDMSAGNLLSNDGKVTYPWETKYTGINSKNLADNLTLYRNSMQDIYNHIKQRRAVYYILSSYDVPYLTFDGINDTDYHMIRDNPMQYINKSEVDGCYSGFLYNDDESYVWKEMDFLNSYYEELVNNTPLLNHLTVGDLNEINIQSYICRLGENINGDENYYQADYGTHWSTEGHMEVAKVLEEFISRRYS